LRGVEDKTHQFNFSPSPLSSTPLHQTDNANTLLQVRKDEPSSNPNHLHLKAKRFDLFIVPITTTELATLGNRGEGVPWMLAEMKGSWKFSRRRRRRRPVPLSLVFVKPEVPAF